MGLRTTYGIFGSIVGAMVGAVLAAIVILISALVALLGPFGLSPGLKALFWVLIVVAFATPTALGAYLGVRWSRRIERRHGFNERVEQQKAYIFLGFALIVAVLLILVTLLRS